MAKDTRLSDEEIWLLVTDPDWVEPEYARLLARELQKARAAMRSFLLVWDAPGGVTDDDADGLRALLPEEA